MSAGTSDDRFKVDNDILLCPPKFRAAVEAALADCNAQGLDAVVYEAFRSPELQALYFARGRTVVPPTAPVTFAATNDSSWHGYCLAVDVISRQHFWKPPEGEKWFAKVAESFKRFDCRWGGDWTRPDLPHFQWALQAEPLRYGAKAPP